MAEKMLHRRFLRGKLWPPDGAVQILGFKPLRYHLTLRVPRLELEGTGFSYSCFKYCTLASAQGLYVLLLTVTYHCALSIILEYAGEFMKFEFLIIS
ncbi:uncharacterized protein J3R85_018049 [Psidium guajava]|nr:uncharacterized protein J3R85_018049 [Psidium guajava]